MIKFFNVRSGEVVVIPADLEPIVMDARIAAYWNSSDQNVNGIVQDFGWRLDPETLKKVREIEQDEVLMERIADRSKVTVDDLTVPNILGYISSRAARAYQQEQAKDEVSHQREYEERVRALDDDANAKEDAKVALKAKSTKKPKVATQAEIDAQAKVDAKKLEDMVAADKETVDNSSVNKDKEKK